MTLYLLPLFIFGINFSSLPPNLLSLARAVIIPLSLVNSSWSRMIWKMFSVHSNQTILETMGVGSTCEIVANQLNRNISVGTFLMVTYFITLIMTDSSDFATNQQLIKQITKKCEPLIYL